MSPARPLKIVQILAAPYPTRQGSQVYVQGMARALAQIGHDVTLVCYGHGDGLQDEGYRVVRTPQPKSYQNRRAGPDAWKPVLDVALAALVTREARGADVLHAHNYEAPIAAYMARAATGTPVVYNAHNTMGEELHRYFSGARSQRIAQRVGNLLDQAVPHRADAALGISQAGVDQLRTLGCDPVYLAPPGVALDDLRGANAEAARARYGLDDRPWVIYAGNPDGYQDLEVWVEAMATLPDVGLLMLSASPLEHWQTQAHAAGISTERSRFICTSSWPEVRDAIAAADLAALPRAVCSGFPIKLLNTLGLGTPTIVAEGSSQPIAGVIPFENHNAQDMAGFIRSALANPNALRALGEAARRDIAARWSWTARVREIEAVYMSLLSSTAKARTSAGKA